MNRLNRLKWIPMLLKAYNDAQVLIEHEKNTGNKALIQEKAGAVANETQVTPADSSKTKKPKLKRNPIPARVMDRSKQSNLRNEKNSYRQVIRELRRTQHKLNRLESIHEQLNQMQSQLETQLKEITERFATETAGSSKKRSQSDNPKTFL